MGSRVVGSDLHAWHRFCTEGAFWSTKKASVPASPPPMRAGPWELPPLQRFTESIFGIQYRAAYRSLESSHLDASVQDMAYLYAAYASDRKNGTSEASNFQVALRQHQLIDQIVQTSETFSIGTALAASARHVRLPDNCPGAGPISVSLAVIGLSAVAV
jgi:hypothetical protein